MPSTTKAIAILVSSGPSGVVASRLGHEWEREVTRSVGPGVWVQIAGGALGLVFVIFLAVGWWIPAILVAAVGFLPIFSIRRAVINERIDEALAAKAEYDATHPEDLDESER
ncbi:hypothetical protein [Microbacterium sp. P02]|uniref:hypothetical protein n=1 Tax=Microbacterium sp. P02 TaxID=3366260 RepID=UPI00366AC1C0